MPKRYPKKSVKRKNRKYSKKSRKSVCKRSYSRKKIYGGSNNINKKNSTNSKTTTNSVDDIPIEEKAVIVSSNSNNINKKNSTNSKNVNNTKSVNQFNITNSKTTTNSVDGIPIEKKAVIVSSNSFMGTGEEYRNHKDYIDFQGKRDL
jgi:hypothetical protein